MPQRGLPVFRLAGRRRRVLRGRIRGRGLGYASDALDGLASLRFIIAQIFFGLWLVPLGYLAYKSAMFPKALGVVLIVGGVSYLVDMLVAFLVPDLSRQIHGLLAIPPAIAEIGMVGYLLWIGLRPSPPSDRAPAAAEVR